MNILIMNKIKTVKILKLHQKIFRIAAKSDIKVRQIRNFA